MILRMWKGQATAEKAGDYVKHATETVFPKLKAIAGHRGAYLLQRRNGEVVEFMVLTLWGSMEAVHQFAGIEPDKAVVEPEARSVLIGFDANVTHYEVVYGE